MINIYPYTHTQYLVIGRAIFTPEYSVKCLFVTLKVNDINIINSQSVVTQKSKHLKVCFKSDGTT